MDAHLIRKGIFAALVSVALVFFIVFASNTDFLRRANAQVKSKEIPEAKGEVIGQKTPYGEQIGNDLRGFVSDESFFDEPETEEETETEGDGKSVTMDATVNGHQITVRVVDNDHVLLKGTAFSVYSTRLLARKADMRAEEHTDSDKDGIIFTLPDDGTYFLSLKEMKGFHMPADVWKAEIGDPNAGQEEPEEETEEQASSENPSGTGEGTGSIVAEGDGH